MRWCLKIKYHLQGLKPFLDKQNRNIYWPISKSFIFVWRIYFYRYKSSGFPSLGAKTLKFQKVWENRQFLLLRIFNWKKKSIKICSNPDIVNFNRKFLLRIVDTDCTLLWYFWYWFTCSSGLKAHHGVYWAGGVTRGRDVTWCRSKETIPSWLTRVQADTSQEQCVALRVTSSETRFLIGACNEKLGLLCKVGFSFMCGNTDAGYCNG